MESNVNTGAKGAKELTNWAPYHFHSPSRTPPAARSTCGAPATAYWYARTGRNASPVHATPVSASSTSRRPPPTLQHPPRRACAGSRAATAASSSWWVVLAYAHTHTHSHLKYACLLQSCLLYLTILGMLLGQTSHTSLFSMRRTLFPQSRNRNSPLFVFPLQFNTLTNALARCPNCRKV